MNHRKTAETVSFLERPMSLEQAGAKNQQEFLFLARHKKDLSTTKGTILPCHLLEIQFAS